MPRDLNRPALLFTLVLVATVGIRVALFVPAHNYLLDFRAYYAAGVALRQGVDPYDVEAVRAAVSLPQPAVAILPYLYPPPTLVLAVASSWLPYPIAQVPWALLQFGLALVALAAALRAAGVRLDSWGAALTAAVFLAGTSTAALFELGQFDMIVAALLAGGTWALERRRPWLTGLLLSLAIFAKLTPLVFLAVLALRKAWRETTATAVWVTIIGAVTLVALPPAFLASWIGSLQSAASWLASDNVSLRGFVIRAFVAFDSHHGPSVPWWPLSAQMVAAITLAVNACVGLATAAWLWTRRRQATVVEAFAAAIPALLLVSPVTWHHHGVILVVTYAVIATAVVRSPELPALDVIWLAAAAVLLLSSPVRELDLRPPGWLAHLISPTQTYGTILVWLYMIARYPVRPSPAPA